LRPRLVIIAAALAALAAGLAAPKTARADDVRISAGTLFYSDDDRVTVVSPQLGVTVPLDDLGAEVSARVTADVVSAASVDVISHATPGFHETRTAAALTASYGLGAWRPSLGLSGSFEPDYRSLGGAVAASRRLGSADSTLALSYGVLFDVIGRVDTPASAFSADLDTHTVSVGLTQNLDAETVVRAVYTLTAQLGAMEKPYRYVPLFDQAGLDAAAAAGVPLGLSTFDRFRLPSRPPEAVPDTRLRHAFALRALRYLPALDASLRLDYRFYVDSWAMQAHTVELGARFNLGAVELGVVDRFHWQAPVAFWRRTYVVAGPLELPEWRSLDRELGGQWANTAELRGRYTRGPIELYATAGVMFTRFDDFLLLDQRTALLAQLGLRVSR
jgi:hypothetical protein